MSVSPSATTGLGSQDNACTAMLHCTINAWKTPCHRYMRHTLTMKN